MPEAPRPSNGKTPRELVLSAIEAERREIADRYLYKPRPDEGGTQLCFDIGCWEPAKESWEQFLARTRRV